MSSLSGFVIGVVIGVVVGPIVWLIGFVLLDVVISSYEYARVRRESLSDRMKDILREFRIIR